MSLKQKTITGLSWSFASQIGKQLSQFVITIILARLLLPSDFGLIGMVTVFTGISAILIELGMAPALIQKQNADAIHYSSAFWVNVIMGFILMLLMILAAPWIALFYNAPILKVILMVLSINFVINSFGSVQQAMLTKEMDFKKLMIRDISAVIVSGIAGVILALKGFGVWSLVYQQIIFTAFNTALLWFFSPWRPDFKFSFDAIRDIFHFSINTIGFQLTNYASRNIDTLLIGKFMGAHELGLYSLAYKLMMLPLQNISWAIGNVTFPAFSSIQHDLQKVRLNYLKMIKAISLVTFPMMFVLAVVAPEFIKIAYGPRWEPVIRLVQILSLCGLLQSIGTTVGTIFRSQGRPDIEFKFNLFFGMPTVFIAVFCGLPFGIVGVAAFITLRMVIFGYGIQYFANRLIGLSWKEFFNAQKESLIIACTAAAMGIGLGLIINSFPMTICHYQLILAVKTLGSLAVVILLAMKFNVFNIQQRFSEIIATRNLRKGFI